MELPELAASKQAVKAANKAGGPGSYAQEKMRLLNGMTTLINMRARQAAMAQAQEARRLVVEGVVKQGDEDEDGLEGEYQLLEGKVANNRAVWQKQGEGAERFLFCPYPGSWVISTRAEMEFVTAGTNADTNGFMYLRSKVLTPDQWVKEQSWNSPCWCLTTVSSPLVLIDARVQRQKEL
jgi:hypothetical protein